MSRVKITDEMLIESVKNSLSFAGILRYLGLKQAGGSQSHYTMRIRNLCLDTSHFTGQAHNKDKKILSRTRPKEEILVFRESGRRQKPRLLIRCMLESGLKHKCSKCDQLPEWLGNKLTLDVDHINENWLDDRLENLRFLCPNCHSQYSRNLIK